jgi:hypothetical protein
MRQKLFTATTVATLALASFVQADPPAPSPFPVPPPRVFCFRVTDIEGHPTDPNRYRIQFEFLNWTNKPAHGTYIWVNEGSTAVSGNTPRIIDAGVDADGRGGPLGGQHIGSSVYNSPAHHSGRGRGDIPDHLNDWELVFRGPTSVYWGDGGVGDFTPIPFRSLLTVPSAAAQFALVPGLGNDGLLVPDAAIDGGPGPYGPPTQPAPFAAGGPPQPDGSGNVLDGFWIEVEDFHVGEVLSMNWILADENGESIGQIGSMGNVVGNGMGFGLFNLARIPVGSSLPPGVFLGNSGFSQGINFYANVYQVPDAGSANNPAEFGVEFGAALLAPPQNPEVANEVPTTVPPSIVIPNVDPEQTPANAQEVPCSIATPGDANGNGVVNVADLQCTLLVNVWETAGNLGPAPGCLAVPLSVIDLNCDDSITIVDVQLAVSFAFDQPLPIEIDGNGNRCHDSCDCSAALCDDNNACTVDQCSLSGGCQNLPTSCSDGNPCTTDSCHPVQGCVFAPVGCGGAPGCTIPNGTACNDGSACTTGDACASGSCQGTAVNCNDNNPCTTDSCSASTGCVHTNVANGTGCGGGNQCIAGNCIVPSGCSVDGDCAPLNTACRTFKCVSTGVVGVNQCVVATTTVCNDNNQCTDDSCNPATGCVYVVDNTNPCNDGSVCTLLDACQGGACVGLSELCDDGNPCSVDFCDSNTACFSTPLNGVPCDDNNQCTTNTACVLGHCRGPQVNCNDNSACTLDSCNPATGCVNQAITCNDNKLCTDDSCSPATGCVFTNNTVSCNDNSVCTTGDACSGGTCGGTPISCNDGFSCTTDSCHPTLGCQYTPNNAACNDGVACTADSCVVGQGCRNLGNNALCDDDEFCTEDVCTPTGCAFPNNNGPCDDGNVCTVGDECVAGACQPGPDLCAFGNLQGTEFCHVAGEANDVFNCTVRVARKTTTSPVVGGFQFRVVNPDPALVEIINVVGVNCTNGNCVEAPVGSPLATGHFIALNPTAMSQWNNPAGGIALVYGPPTGVTTAYVNAIGNPVGDAEVLRLKVRVKAPIAAEQPVKLSYLDVATTTTQGADMVTGVEFGTIVADYPCPLPLQDADNDTYPETCPVCDGVNCLELNDVFCFVSGAQNEAVECPIEVVRRSAGSPPIGGVQFRVELPPGAPLAVEDLTGTACPFPGVCVEAPFPPPSGQSYFLASGHQVAASPADPAAWPNSSGGNVLIFGSGLEESLSDAYLTQAGISGTAEVLRLKLRLTSAVSAATPLKLRLRQLSATSRLGQDLEAEAVNGRIVVGVPESSVFCTAFGGVGDVSTCWVRVARKSSTTPTVAGLQFSIPVYDPEVVDIVSLTALKCIDGSLCYEVLMPEGLDTGHQVFLQPNDYPLWSGAGGGGVVVYGGTDTSVTPAYLSSTGSLVGSADFMRLRVQLKAEFTPSAPLELTLASVSASAPDGTDLDTEVVNGTIVVSEEQNNTICELSGFAGQVVSCPVRLARKTSNVPLVGGLQFRLFVDDPAQLQLLSLSADICAFGPCVEQTMPYPLDSGHQVVLSPSNYAQWTSAGQGQVIVYGGTTTGLTNAVLGAGGAVQGDAEFMRVNVRLATGINAANPKPVRIELLGGSTTTGFDLSTYLFGSVIVAE